MGLISKNKYKLKKLLNKIARSIKKVFSLSATIIYVSCFALVILNISNESLIVFTGICDSDEGEVFMDREVIWVSKITNPLKVSYDTEKLNDIPISCKLENAEIRTIFFLMSNLSKVLPVKTVSLHKNRETLENNFSKLTKMTGKHFELSGNCGNAKHKGTPLFLRRVFHNGKSINMNLFNVNSDLLLCPWNESIIMDEISKNEFRFHQVKSWHSNLHQVKLDQLEITFSANDCSSDSERFKRLYRLSGRVLSNTDVDIVISIPALKTHVTCKRRFISEIYPRKLKER